MEAYALLALVTVQILAMSVLHPTRFIRHLRAKLNPAERERDAQLYIERRLAQYRALNTGIAVLGLFLLGWLFSYTRRPDWTDGPIEVLLGVYFMLQMLPICFVSWVVARINKALMQSTPKRTASLHRRTLFDFISPSIIALAVLVYFLFAALVVYIEHHPFPGFAGAFVNIGIVTLGYALVTLGIYTILYRTKTNPLETYAERMRAVGIGVKVAVYSCIGGVVAVAANMALILLDSQRWEPVAQSAFNLVFVLAFMYFTRSGAPPREPTAIGSAPA